MHYKTIIGLIFFLPNIVISDDCIKETAREAVICLEKKITIMDEKIKALDIEPKETKQSKVEKSITADGIKFDLKKCVRKQSKLECVFDVQALDKDNFITLYANYRGSISRVYDSKGGENIVKQIYLSGKSNTAYVQRLLIANIPTKAKLIFDDISADASQISLLRFQYHSKNTNKAGNADFRNVDFAK